MQLPTQVAWPSNAMSFLLLGGQDYFRGQVSSTEYLAQARSRVPQENGTTAFLYIREMDHMPQGPLLRVALPIMVEALTTWKSTGQPPLKLFRKLLMGMQAGGWSGRLMYTKAAGEWAVDVAFDATRVSRCVLQDAAEVAAPDASPIQYRPELSPAAQPCAETMSPTRTAPARRARLTTSHSSHALLASTEQQPPEGLATVTGTTSSTSNISSSAAAAASSVGRSRALSLKEFSTHQPIVNSVGSPLSREHTAVTVEDGESFRPRAQSLYAFHQDPAAANAAAAVAGASVSTTSSASAMTPAVSMAMSGMPMSVQPSQASQVSLVSQVSQITQASQLSQMQTPQGMSTTQQSQQSMLSQQSTASQQPPQQPQVTTTSDASSRSGKPRARLMLPIASTSSGYPSVCPPSPTVATPKMLPFTPSSSGHCPVDATPFSRALGMSPSGGGSLNLGFGALSPTALVSKSLPQTPYIDPSAFGAAMPGSPTAVPGQRPPICSRSLTVPIMRVDHSSSPGGNNRSSLLQ